jgi:uncharacterized protein
MDTNEALGLVQRFARSAKEELPITAVWLYGSWAYGTPREDSDIDVGVALERRPADLLATEKRLFRIRRGIDTRIEPVLIDTDSDPSGFSEMVVRRGIRVNLE